MTWIQVAREIRGEIMNTDVYCEILCPPTKKARAEEYLEKAFEQFRTFDQNYSRFRSDNELWICNHSSKHIASPELFDILSQALAYHKDTQGLFDPSILPDLEHEGYTGAYTNTGSKENHTPSFESLRLDPNTREVHKPANLHLDLGGIGKGYIVDKVASFFGTRFENFLIDAGGDIAARGANQTRQYPYWAIDIEHPKQQDQSLATLMLNNQSVATSGINRRHWIQEGKTKHHLIDPRDRLSATSPFLTVSVILPETVSADVWAKTLFLAGTDAFSLAEQRHIPALFINHDTSLVINSFAQTYVWKPTL